MENPPSSWGLASLAQSGLGIFFRACTRCSQVLWPASPTQRAIPPRRDGRCDAGAYKRDIDTVSRLCIVVPARPTVMESSHVLDNIGCIQVRYTLRHGAVLHDSRVGRIYGLRIVSQLSPPPTHFHFGYRMQVEVGRRKMATRSHNQAATAPTEPG